jgi:anti-sigma B factor antagonist
MEARKSVRHAVEEQGGYAVVRLTGDVDISSSPEARRLILAELARRHQLLVDLSAVSYIDSSGIACLVEAYQAARKGGGRFALLGVSGEAMSVLSLARLDRVFPIYRSVADFVAAG